MALSLDTIQAHIEEWSPRLDRYPLRKDWARSLFHAAQLENAVEIVRRGAIVCRNDLGPIPCDVADQGALYNNHLAHDCARLYFRPRNLFHLVTEGIKTKSDRYRRDPHMSMPFMFVFDLARVLQIEGVSFTDGMASRSLFSHGLSDAEFSSLDFQKIYHEGPINGDQQTKDDIQNSRMAEVLVPSLLSLEFLKFIVCRSLHEKQTLLHHMRFANDAIKRRVITENSGRLFMRKGVYIRELYRLGPDLKFSLSLPSTAAQPTYDVVVTVGDTRLPMTVGPGTQSVPIGGPTGNVALVIEVEDCVAYHGPVPDDLNLV